jgi:CheY-like chemotaxis protein
MKSSAASARKLLVLRGPGCGQDDSLEVLARLGNVRVVDSIEDALDALRKEAFEFVVSETSDFLPLERANVSQQAHVVLETIAEGVCVIDPIGRLLWANRKLQQFAPDVIERVKSMCVQAFQQTARHLVEEDGTPCGHRMSLAAADDHYLEVNATPIVDAGGALQQIAAVVWDSTAARRLQQKIEAIDMAGRELVRIDAETIQKLDMRQRLELLEDKIIRHTRELLRFDNVVIRILDRTTGKLELVLAAGLPPEAQQIEVSVGTEGNGISGYVAATARSYICPDVRKDTRYLRGIDDARSSLTVPLKLHDEVIGIFNVESNRLGAFTEEDRQFLEIFGRHVAIALRILDLLVVERRQTSGQLASDVACEIAGPLNDILTDVSNLQEDYIGYDDLRHRLSAVADNVVSIREIVKEVTQLPCGVLGYRDREFKRDPTLAGKIVLVVDDDSVIRQTIRDVLTRVGCVVELAENGEQGIALVTQRSYDLVLTDIHMPGKNGYDVFLAAKTADPQRPILFMTGFGYDPSHTIIRARQEGLNAVLFKPFKVDHLLAELRTALTRI